MQINENKSKKKAESNGWEGKRKKREGGLDKRREQECHCKLSPTACSLDSNHWRSGQAGRLAAKSQDRMMDQMGKRSSEGGWMEVRLALEVQHSRQGGIPDVPSNGSKNNTENNNQRRTRSAK
ncbi:hypothetical protein BO83DRAFT_456007 [Aspergillus eucalypticola CBS 122712]|uniref:Uncharacterized protein n=1 Tax=Aspergillus eucalypticola (strain CBS 122712 / IBT 29274) TaxID=1448314 RepID=A0A317UPW5_ASPEC|nr:uncharacterized protein BO83DRAFT_456007 [Aspergillus eucalypticola CBS 122712]PWY64023.1 hypothetical protein BO83DRAFT_456007 [Aspergillus eucalypticola CBS 122712]